jgi:hypothetical protein
VQRFNQRRRTRRDALSDAQPAVRGKLCAVGCTSLSISAKSSGVPIGEGRAVGAQVIPSSARNCSRVVARLECDRIRLRFVCHRSGPRNVTQIQIRKRPIWQETTLYPRPKTGGRMRTPGRTVDENSK